LTDIDEIDNLLPLPPDQVRVYLMENSTQRPLIDRDSGLVDDTLLAYFNQINVLYDRMRDIEWDRRND